jgi:GTP cyclohydrolase I
LAADMKMLETAVRQFLEGLGVSLDAGVAERTAVRVAEAWVHDLVRGYALDPGEILANTWVEGGSEIVVMKDIDFTSVCRDHLLPFRGTASVAYLPDGRVTGLSKIADLVDCLSRRLQIQESLTQEIADAVMEHLKPLGAACLVKAKHCCVSARGPRKAQATVTTLCVRGAFSTDRAYKEKLLQLVR